MSNSITTIQTCVSSAHMIVLARTNKDSKEINTSAMLIELVSAIIISILIFTFSNQITYVYHLENNAREILSIILKLKAIQLPLLALGYVPKNILKVNKQANKIWITTVISSLVNIIGDYISIKCGYNEIGIYVATIISLLHKKTSEGFIESLLNAKREKLVESLDILVFPPIITRSASHTS